MYNYSFEFSRPNEIFTIVREFAASDVFSAQRQAEHYATIMGYKLIRFFGKNR